VKAFDVPAWLPKMLKLVFCMPTVPVTVERSLSGSSYHLAVIEEAAPTNMPLALNAAARPAIMETWKRAGIVAKNHWPGARSPVAGARGLGAVLEGRRKRGSAGTAQRVDRSGSPAMAANLAGHPWRNCLTA